MSINQYPSLSPVEIIDNLASIEAELSLRDNLSASLERPLVLQHKWAELQPRFRFHEDDLLFRLAVNFKRKNKFSLAKICLERMQNDAYPDRSNNIAMLTHLLEIAQEIDELTHDSAGVMRLHEFLGGAPPILGSLDRIRQLPNEAFVRLMYYVVELAFDHFVLFEQLDAYLNEGNLPSDLPQHKGVHWSPMIHLTAGILHDLLTHLGSPTRLIEQLRGQPVWGKVQNLYMLRLLRVLIAASSHKLTGVSLHGALGIISKAPENVIGRYLMDFLDLLTMHWHWWGAEPAFEGRDID